MKTIKLLKTSMRKAGMNQTQLAEKVGVSKAYISAMFRFGNTRNIAVVKQICKVLQVSKSEIKDCIIYDYGREFSARWEEE